MFSTKQSKSSKVNSCPSEWSDWCNAVSASIVEKSIAKCTALLCTVRSPETSELAILPWISDPRWRISSLLKKPLSKCQVNVSSHSLSSYSFQVSNSSLRKVRSMLADVSVSICSSFRDHIG